MADQGRSDFYALFTMSLCILELKQTLNKFVISNHTALKLDIPALRRYFSIICEYELYILPNKKVSTARDHGKDYIKVRLPLVHHLLRNCLLERSTDKRGINWGRIHGRLTFRILKELEYQTWKNIDESQYIHKNTSLIKLQGSTTQVRHSKVEFGILVSYIYIYKYYISHLWVTHFGDNVLHHCEETCFRHETYRIFTRY